MGKVKTADKKTKAVTSQKVSARQKASRKPIKLGGVPNQGSVANMDAVS
jgi:hypothetical protein